MGSAVTYLHIGAPKTGTTFLQDTLWENRVVLRDQGVLVPGSTRYSALKAGRDALSWPAGQGQPLPRSWRRLARQVEQWAGASAVISQEYLTRLDSAAAERILAAFDAGPVKVVLTTRDIGRIIPAQWQTALSTGKTWSLEEYANGVVKRPSRGRSAKAANHFWRRHDVARIVEQWAGMVGLSNVIVATVPPAGSAASELWDRFAAACSFDPSPTTTPPPVYESLGAASAELVRRLNEHELVREMTREQYRSAVHVALTRRALPIRRKVEPAIALPSIHQEWAEKESQRIADLVQSSGIKVIGDSRDLLSHFDETVPTSADQSPPEQVLEAAAVAIEYLNKRVARRGARLVNHPYAPEGKTPAERLDRAIDELARLTSRYARATVKPGRARVSSMVEIGQPMARIGHALQRRKSRLPTG